MFGSREKSAQDSVTTERKKKFFQAGVLVSSGAVLICLLTYFTLHGSNTELAQTPPPEPTAELVSSSGLILVQTPGKPGWREIISGESLFEGDLVRTDSSGGAVIRYKSGATVSITRNTVFTIYDRENNQMEIGVSPSAEGVTPLLLAGERGSPATGARDLPFIELDQIIQFGRSLELIGKIEAGSSLMVNQERVEVAGDGSFKHFTSPFPSWAGTVTLSLKVRDLAGRTHVWTANHNFRPHGTED
jgi:hypothetical protein